VIAPSGLKSLARQIFIQTLAGIDIRQTLREKLQLKGTHLRMGGRHFDLARFARMRIVALGKASLAMAAGFEALLAPKFKATGILVAPAAGSAATDAAVGLAGFEIFQAGHPVPNEQSFAAARAILNLLAGCDAETLVIFLLSGGGSSLVELPLDPAISLADVQALYRLLVGCGASIEEINTVRKHLSAVKGGRLAQAAGAATKITLAVTDVPEGRESALASGPTLADPTTVADARRVVEAFGLLPQLPVAIREKLTTPAAVPETPKAGDAAFRNSHFEVVLGMHDLFHQAQTAAEAAGFLTLCDNSTDDWPVPRAAEHLLAQLGNWQQENRGRRVALVADGEVSSPVSGGGMGGRNSALVLECAKRIVGQRLAVLSAGTDGIDGSSPAAGAVADGATLERAAQLRLDPEDFHRRSDSFHFFEALGDTVMTGPTGNNLRDLRIFLASAA
jgi:glycerate 2-kinase